MKGSVGQLRTWRRLAAWTMLVAVIALVVQGATPAFARLAPIAHTGHATAAHADCPGHADAAGQAADHGRHAEAAPPQTDHENHPMPARQLDCCTATTALVLPAVARVRGRETQAHLFLLPSVFLPEGLAPEGPSKPPRTSYPG